MKLNNAWITLSAAALLLAFPLAGALAAGNDAAAEDAQLQAEYEAALQAAEQERVQARASIDRARAEMQRAAEEQARYAGEAEQAREAYAKANEQARLARAEEIAAMREELSRAHDELRRASREVARVHRELEGAGGVLAPRGGLINLGDRAVIGVILGDSTDAGVKVLGVSPDGPADRAGIQQGDVIVSIMGKKLVSDGETPARVVLQEVMEGVKAGDELLIAVDRDGDRGEYAVVAERREPFGWTSMLRLPSVPAAPGAPVVVERIEIPEIDSAALAEQMERLSEDLDRARFVIKTHRGEGPGEAPEAWEFEFENLSEIGEEAMLGANLWFGMPMTQGLKLAEIDAGLGEYFKTDRGVLVLKARPDNELQLESGDVILAVGGKEVNKPSDVMRALRDLAPGSNLEISIMRDRRDRNLEVVVPEHRTRYGFAPELEHGYHYRYEIKED